MVRLLLGLDRGAAAARRGRRAGGGHLPRAQRRAARRTRSLRRRAREAARRRRAGASTDHDCVPARPARRESSRTASSSTSAASATTCPCRCRRSTRSATPAPTWRCAIHTHVREDTLALYGFGTALEQQIFERLIGISGIGPKLALAVLSGIDVADLVRAVQAGDVARLTAIPGVGKKTAERIGLELKDKLPRRASPRGRPARRGGRRAGRRPAPRPALGAPEPGISSAARGEGRRRRAGADRVADLRSRAEAGAARAGARVAWTDDDRRG